MSPPEDLGVRVEPPPDLAVTVVGDPAVRVEVGVAPAAPEVVEVRVPGQAGPRGREGQPGPPGVPGKDGDKTYVHVQAAAEKVWDCPHGLGKIPSTTLRDDLGNHIGGDVLHDPDGMRSTVTYLVPVSGTASFN